MSSNALFRTPRPLLTDNFTRWAVIAIVGLVSAVGLWELNITIVWEFSWLEIELAIFLLLCSVIYSIVGTQTPRLGLSTAIVSDLLLSILQLVVAVKAFTRLIYLAAASGYPLVDSTLTRLDAMLFGFEWYVEANWAANYPVLDWLLQRAYSSLYYQGALAFLIGSVSRPGDRNGELIWQFCISLVLTCAIFVFTPALGHVAHIGTGWMKTLTMIRNGEWAALDFSHIEGIVSFPSFHTTLAILLVYAVRHHRWALAVLFPLNVLLIVATLSVGGHYLVDLPAGAAVAVIKVLPPLGFFDSIWPDAACGHFATWRMLRRASEPNLQRLRRHNNGSVGLAAGISSTDLSPSSENLNICWPMWPSSSDRAASHQTQLRICQSERRLERARRFQVMRRIGCKRPRVNS